MFCVHGGAMQSDIIRMFGVTPISVERSVKTYRQKRPKLFSALRVTRGSAVLLNGVVTQVEHRLADGVMAAAVTEELGVKPNTLQKAIRAGRIRTPIKNKQLTPAQE